MSFPCFSQRVPCVLFQVVGVLRMTLFAFRKSLSCFDAGGKSTAHRSLPAARFYFGSRRRVWEGLSIIQPKSRAEPW